MRLNVKLEKAIIYLSLIAVFGIIVFTIESFYPIGNWMRNNFGIIADITGSLLGFITLSMLILWIGFGIWTLMDWIKNK